MKSKNKIIPLEKIVKPFLYKPKEDVNGGVNGVKFDFKKGKKYEITYPIFEVLLHANKLII